MFREEKSGRKVANFLFFIFFLPDRLFGRSMWFIFLPAQTKQEKSITRTKLSLNTENKTFWKDFCLEWRASTQPTARGTKQAPGDTHITGQRADTAAMNDGEVMEMASGRAASLDRPRCCGRVVSTAADTLLFVCHLCCCTAALCTITSTYATTAVARALC